MLLYFSRVQILQSHTDVIVKRKGAKCNVPAAGGVPADEAPPFLEFLRRRSSTATTQGSGSTVEEGAGVGGSMGVAMCASLSLGARLARDQVDTVVSCPHHK